VPPGRYELCAILIHRGPSASSGHYGAQVRGADGTTWWELDDECVLPVKPGKGRTQIVLGELESDTLYGETKTKVKLPPQGVHQSRNVYLLTYQRKGSGAIDTDPIPSTVPEALRTEVEAQNVKTHDEISKVQSKALLDVEASKKLGDDFCEMHSALRVVEIPDDPKSFLGNTSYMFAPLDFLKSFFKSEVIDGVPQ
jgi:hypothetical protein